jgi:hypothetical protein
MERNHREYESTPKELNEETKQKPGIRYDAAFGANGVEDEGSYE